MNLVFRDQIDNELGRIEHQNIHEILIPAFKEDAHDMFIKRVFHGHPEVNTWQILEMVTDNLDVYLKLRPIASISSLKDFAKTQNKTAEQFLKKYCLVEVDFGFYSDILNHKGERFKNRHHTHTLLAGELHKRRPCIVMGVKNQQVQIIPLSTKKATGKDPKNLLVQPLPKKLDQRYHDQDTFALIHMIQTVSSARVYPPRSHRGKYEHKYLDYKIHTSLQESLQQVLAMQYTQSIVATNLNLQEQLIKIKHERSQLLDKYKALRDKQELTNRVEKILLKIGQDLGYGSEINEVIENYEKEK